MLRRLAAALLPAAFALIAGLGLAAGDAAAQTNAAPTVAIAIPDQAAGADRAFNYTFPTTTFHDSDDDTLTYTAVEDGETGLPSWLTFTGRTFSGTPAVSDAGTLTVKVTADDGNGGSVSDSFDIVVGATDVCFRTAAVRDAIVAAVTGVSDCSNLTPAHLAGITGTLDLSRKGIETPRAGDFDGLTALEELWLYNAHLTSLQAGVFDGLTALEVLDLSENPHLTSLPASVFDGLTALSELWMGDSGLTSLPAGVFDNLTALRELRLDDNSLTSLPAGVFDGLAALGELRLEGNSLTSLPAGVFDGLTALQELWLTDNSLTSLPSGVFDNLTSLRELYLGRNSLTSLPAGVFDGLTALQELWMSDNSLTTLPAGVFDGLTALRELYVARNSLSSLPTNVFDNLTKLTLLSLTRNSLTTLPSGVFDKLTALKSLRLGNNPGVPFKPVANAGADRTVLTNSLATLSGTATGPWGNNVTWEWTQVDGASSNTPVANPVALRRPTSATPSFNTPDSPATPLHFKAIAVPVPRASSRDGTAVSAADWVTLTTEAKTPSAPESFTARPDAGDARLSWAPPRSNGGAPITEYQVLWSPGGSFVAVPDSGDTGDSKGDETHYTVSSLTAGTEYTFYVRAHNRKGGSALAETTFTPISASAATAPMAPVPFTATPGDKQVGLSWTPPEERGAVVTKYQYKVSPGGGDTWVDVPDSNDAGGDAGDETGYTVTSLTNGTPYTFLVRAATRVGASDTAEAKATPNSLRNVPANAPFIPSVPIWTGARGVAGGIEVWWAPPLHSGDGSVVSYEYRVRPAGTQTRITDFSCPDNVNPPVCTAVDEFAKWSATASPWITVPDSDDVGSVTSDERRVVIEKQNATTFLTAQKYYVLLRARTSGTHPVSEDWHGIVPLSATPLPPPEMEELTITIDGIGPRTLTAADFGYAADDRSDLIVRKAIADDVGWIIQNGSRLYTVFSASRQEIDDGQLKFLARPEWNGEGAYMVFSTRKDPTRKVLRFEVNNPSAITPVCRRTPAVRDAIVNSFSWTSDCRDIRASHLAGLEELIINTSSLALGDFDGLTALTQLDLNNFGNSNSLTTLPAGVFDKLTALEVLFLNDNSLTTLPTGIFDGLTELTKLDLDGNSLASLPAGIFDKLTKLTILFLQSNDLSSLPTNVFDDLTSLRDLRLGFNGNSFTSLPSGIFDKLTALTRLSLNNNRLTTLPAGIFDKLTKLTRLALRSNSLASLPSGVFNKLTKLTRLTLDSNTGEPFKPVANAGADRRVLTNSLVTLSGTGTGAWGSNVTWAWKQVDGASSNMAATDPVTLANATSATPSFTAPGSVRTLHFRLITTPVPAPGGLDGRGIAASAANWITVTVATSLQTAAPSVSSVALSDPPGGDGAWDAGETVEAVLTFDEAVTVDTTNGTPTVQFQLGTDTTRRNAGYASGSGGTALTFRYTVPAGQGPYTNALLAINSLALNGGTIRSGDGADAALAHSGAAYAGAVIGSKDSGPTARFSALPASHDGTNAFTLELTFSGDPGGLGYKTVRDSLIVVTGGDIENARRKTKGSDIGWVLTVRPSGRGSVTLTLPSRACGTKTAVCIGGEPLASDATAAVPGPDTPAPALPTISIAAPAETPVDEGAALSFTLARTGATEATLTVAVSVAETGDVLDGTPPASVRFASGSATAALSVPTLDDEAFEEASTVTVTVAGGTGYTVAADAASASGTVESEDLAPITAQFTQAQDEHDGGAFLLRFTFSHAPLLSYVTVRDALFDVTGGRIERARRLARGSNAGWELRVVPDGFGDVALTARATADCAAAHAVCDAAGRKFDGALERTIQGPPTLSIADAAVDEARGAVLEFAVTLSRALDTAVTVAWKTADVTAEAGEDYTAANDTLTFTAGQTAKTISVAVLTDAHDEGSETLTVTLSNPAPTRVKLADGAATGTIRNTDAMPQAWIARFGRTVAEQVLDAVEGRLRAARTPGVEVSLAGERIGWRPEAGDGQANAEDRTARAAAAKDAAADEEAGREAKRLAEWLRGETDPEEEGRRRARTVGNRQLLLGSSFNVTAEAGGPGSGGGTVSVWGRGAVTGFDGRDGELTVDGEVASAMLGADWSPGSGSGAGRGRALAGLIVGHSTGEGGYRSPSGNGVVSSTLTGLYPWGRYALSDRVEVWGAAGYGEGALTLTPEGGDAIRTDMDLWMAAAGLRGTVIDGGADGFTLTAKTDAMAVETSTAAVPGDLAASEVGVTRLRLGLEGSLPVRLGGGAVLTPSMEIGARHDGGDAETGFGADIGGGIAWKDERRGIAAGIRGRGLLTHEADGFRERGLSGTLGWNPAEGGRGSSLSLTQTFGGAASGGADALLRRGTMEGLAANPGSGSGAGSNDLKARRLEARFGYGIAAFGGGFTLTPEAGFGLSDTGRDYSLGWRLVRVERGGGLPGASLELSFEATRRESAANDNIPPEHGVGLRLTSRF